jgi:hypothetical protein
LTCKNLISNAKKLEFPVEQAAKVKPFDQQPGPPVALEDNAAPQDVIPNQDYSMSLLKSTIEETLENLKNTKRGTVEIDDSGKRVKRLLIEEDFNFEEASAKIPKVSHNVEYMDTDGRNEQLRLIQALKPAKPKVFLFSGITAADRTKYINHISTLGATVIMSDTWDPSCTHLLINKVIKTEKLLCACASTSWLDKLGL